jgi:hypothetical protein
MFALYLLPLLLVCQPNYADQDQEEGRQLNGFTAYDCSSPYDVQDVGFSIKTNCITNTVLAQHRNVTYQVLQEERFRVSYGWTCSVEKSRKIHYCGAFDHETTFTPKTYYKLPWVITDELCHHLWQTQTYTDPKGYLHKVYRDAINVVQYDEKGSSYLSNGEVKCKGEDYKDPDTLTIMKEAQVSIHLVITLKKERYHYNKDGVVAQTSGTRLPCRIEDLGFSTSTATYIWETPADEMKCELAVAHEVTGVEATNTAGQEIFMSTDGSLQRFILREDDTKCGRIVRSTQLPGWYLYPVTNRKLFTRKINPGAMSATTYVQNRDDYLFNYIANSVHDEFSYVSASDCRRQLEQSRLSYWIQHKSPDSTTWLIEDGIFGSSSGEVIYQYRCQPVTVVARETDACYQALPVDRLEDLHHQDSSLPISRPLFMEPLTKRLTHHGIEIPCMTKFSSKWKNDNGGWINHHQRVQDTAPPLPPSQLYHTQRRVGPLDPRYRPQAGEGGVYKTEDIKAMERYLDLPRATLAMKVDLATQALKDRSRKGKLHPEDLFPEYEDPRKWVQGLWGQIITFLQEWGELFSILISLYCIFRVGITIFGWFYSLFILRDLHGCGKTLCWIPFISYFLIRQYRDSPYGRQSREKRVHRRNQKVQAKVPPQSPLEIPIEGYLTNDEIASPRTPPFERPSLYPTRELSSVELNNISPPGK